MTAYLIAIALASILTGAVYTIVGWGPDCRLHEDVAAQGLLDILQFGGVSVLGNQGGGDCSRPGLRCRDLVVPHPHIGDIRRFDLGVHEETAANPCCLQHVMDFPVDDRHRSALYRCRAGSLKRFNQALRLAAMPLAPSRGRVEVKPAAPYPAGALRTSAISSEMARTRPSVTLFIPLIADACVPRVS